MKVINRDEFEQANIFGTGLANEAFARYFMQVFRVIVVA